MLTGAHVLGIWGMGGGGGGGIVPNDGISGVEQCVWGWGGGAVCVCGGGGGQCVCVGGGGRVKQLMTATDCYMYVYTCPLLYRIISNISTVLYFFNLPPPRAVNGDVPLLETVPLLFQPHFRGMLPCQIHVRHTHFRVISPVLIMNLNSVLIMETEHFIF